jgi:hypothetical protein
MPGTHTVSFSDLIAASPANLKLSLNHQVAGPPRHAVC